MNLDNLKPAWRQFRLLNSMQSMEHEEILSIIERSEARAVGRFHRLLANSVLFIILAICSQGG